MLHNHQIEKLAGDVLLLDLKASDRKQSLIQKCQPKNRFYISGYKNHTKISNRKEHCHVYIGNWPITRIIVYYLVNLPVKVLQGDDTSHMVFA